MEYILGNEKKKKNKKILVLMGESLYNVLRLASKQIVDGFTEEGYDVLVVDAHNREMSIIDALSINCFEFIFANQAFFFPWIFDDGRYWIDNVQIPCYGWVFDDLLYHEIRVDMCTRANAVLFTIDKKAREYLRFIENIEKHLFFYHMDASKMKNQQIKQSTSCSLDHIQILMR